MSQKKYKRLFPDKKVGGFVPGWQTPVVSDSEAVHPDQVAEFIEDAKKLGVPTDYQPTGEPIFTSTDHKRRYLRAYHKRERNAYY